MKDGRLLDYAKCAYILWTWWGIQVRKIFNPRVGNYCEPFRLLRFWRRGNEHCASFRPGACKNECFYGSFVATALEQKRRYAVMADKFGRDQRGDQWIER